MSGNINIRVQHSYYSPLYDYIFLISMKIYFDRMESDGLDLLQKFICVSIRDCSLRSIKYPLDGGKKVFVSSL